MTDKEIMEILESEELEKGDCNCAYIPGCGESTKYDSDYIVAEINDYTQTLQFFPELYWDYRDGTVKTGCEKIVLFYYGENVSELENSDYVPLDETACIITRYNPYDADVVKAWKKYKLLKEIMED